MNRQQLEERKTKCETNSLCFVSLNPLTKENHVAVEHSVIGTVFVDKKYIK